MFKKVKRIILGAPRNPMHKETRSHIALIAFFAWIGLGADGLSSSCYGPEQAFLALGHHAYLSFYLALMIGVTVFIIALAYNQVIELFPSGGGGYKVATHLIGPYVGVVSGAALILGYVLTIAMSFASGIAALFSFLPVGMQQYKLVADVFAVLVLMYLNLRGMKESIKVFMPIFLGFVITHIFIIIYGIYMHGALMGFVIHTTWQQTVQISHSLGWIFVVALLMRGYSLGGGTYTGLEAVSNNVNNLAEPRIKTGKLSMLYMAISLSIIAGGIILLYLLWDAQPVAGQTLNASTFAAILSTLPHGHSMLILILLLEAGLLFVGANTGFLGGPAVLANMAIDKWVPRKFRNLSSQLVIQNGIFLFGLAAILILLWTDGSILKLVILYSTSVFITFSLSLLGVCIYWAKNRARKAWLLRLGFSIIGFLICIFILITIVITKFTDGGWLAMVVNGIVIASCIAVKRHYDAHDKKLAELDKLLFKTIPEDKPLTHDLDPTKPTAVFFIGDSIGAGLHTLLWVQRMFPDHFKNMIFLSTGVVDVNSYESDIALERMQQKVEKRLQYFVKYAHQHDIPAVSYSAYGTNHVEKLVELAEQVKNDYPDSIFFASKAVSQKSNWFTRQLHNATPTALQRNLHLRGTQMIILPVLLGS